MTQHSNQQQYNSVRQEHSLQAKRQANPLGHSQQSMYNPTNTVQTPINDHQKQYAESSNTYAQMVSQTQTNTQVNSQLTPTITTNDKTDELLTQIRSLENVVKSLEKEIQQQRLDHQQEKRTLIERNNRLEQQINTLIQNQPNHAHTPTVQSVQQPQNKIITIEDVPDTIIDKLTQSIQTCL